MAFLRSEGRAALQRPGFANSKFIPGHRVLIVLNVPVLRPLPCRAVRQQARRRSPAATAPAASHAGASVVHDWLGQQHDQCRAAGPSIAGLEVDIMGTSLHMGLEMEWRLGFDLHGSFVESLAAPEMSCSWGYAAPHIVSQQRASSNAGRSVAVEYQERAALDRNHGNGLQPGGSGTANASSSGGGSSSGSRGTGGHGLFSSGGAAWAADDVGCPRLLELDDEEALLLSSWVRTGAWVLPQVAARLHIRAMPPPHTLYHKADMPDGHEPGSSSSSGGDDQRGSSGAGARKREGGTAWVELRLRGGGKITALLEMCTSSWRPRSMLLQLASEAELWQLSDWRQWAPRLWLAGHAVQSHGGQGGITNTYQLTALQTQQAAERWASSTAAPTSLNTSSSSSSSSTFLHANGGRDSYSSGPARASASASSRFMPPPIPLLPDDTTFLADVAATVPAWYTASGHSLVEPLINGRSVGHFIFDTGASGFVIEPAVAAELGLPGFGELQVASMVGKVASRFRRADTFQLGPLLMRRPLFMELHCSGLVHGLPHGWRVAGIVGHDVMRRAVVHLPPYPARPSLTTAADVLVDGPAAAVAARYAAAKAWRTPQQYSITLQPPAGAEGSWAGSTTSTAATRVVSQEHTTCGSSRNGAPSHAVVGSTAATRGHDATEAPGRAAASSSSRHSGGGSSSSRSMWWPDRGDLQTDLSKSDSHHQEQERQQQATTGQQQAVAPSPQQQSYIAQADQQPHQQRELDWLPLLMVAGLPHVELQLVSHTGRRHRGWFMLDSGAGGFDLFVNPEVAEQLQLGQPLSTARTSSGGQSSGSSSTKGSSSGAQGPPTTVIRGIGGDAGGRLAAQRCQLAEVRLGPATFHQATAMFRTSDEEAGGTGGGGLVLSRHTSGILCAGLLGRCSLVFDYARMRVAVLSAGV